MTAAAALFDLRLLAGAPAVTAAGPTPDAGFALLLADSPDMPAVAAAPPVGFAAPPAGADHLPLLNAVLPEVGKAPCGEVVPEAVSMQPAVSPVAPEGTERPEGQDSGEGLVETEKAPERAMPSGERRPGQTAKVSAPEPLSGWASRVVAAAVAAPVMQAGTTSVGPESEVDVTRGTIPASNDKAQQVPAGTEAPLDVAPVPVDVAPALVAMGSLAAERTVADAEPELDAVVEAPRRLQGRGQGRDRTEPAIPPAAVQPAAPVVPAQARTLNAEVMPEPDAPATPARAAVEVQVRVTDREAGVVPAAVPAMPAVPADGAEQAAFSVPVPSEAGAAATALPGLPRAQAPALANAVDPAVAQAPPPPEPVVHAADRPEKMAMAAGLAIAHRARAGGEDLVIRVAPAGLGDIEVRMSFDDDRGFRAIVAADSPVVLELLRGASADLGRAVTQGGVAADAGSFQFQQRGDSRGQQQQPPAHGPWPRWDTDEAVPGQAAPAVFRPINWRGGLDIRA